MLVTDGGQIIRCPVHDIRVAGRKTQGVTVFKVGDGERVVSVSRLSDDGADETNGNGHDPASPETSNQDGAATAQDEGQTDSRKGNGADPDGA